MRNHWQRLSLPNRQNHWGDSALSCMPNIMLVLSASSRSPGSVSVVSIVLVVAEFTQFSKVSRMLSSSCASVFNTTSLYFVKGPFWIATARLFWSMSSFIPFKTVPNCCVLFTEDDNISPLFIATVYKEHRAQSLLKWIWRYEHYWYCQTAVLQNSFFGCAPAYHLIERD